MGKHAGFVGVSMCYYSFCLFCTVVPPESMHVMVGQDATFSCGGEALAILWFINDQNIDDLGIKDVFERVEDFRTSNITVSGVVEYHNASIQCVLYLSTPTVTIDSLAPVFLTVFGKPQFSDLLFLIESSLHRGEIITFCLINALVMHKYM